MRRNTMFAAFNWIIYNPGEFCAPRAEQLQSARRAAALRPVFITLKPELEML